MDQSAKARSILVERLVENFSWIQPEPVRYRSVTKLAPESPSNARMTVPRMFATFSEPEIANEPPITVATETPRMETMSAMIPRRVFASPVLSAVKIDCIESQPNVWFVTRAAKEA